MSTKLCFTTFLAGLSIFLTACGGTPMTNANISNKTNTINGNVAQTDINSPVATNKKPEVATANNAPTIGPVVQAYYDALKKKDDAALKNVLSAGYIKSVQADMKKEKQATMAAFLAQYEIIPDKPVEVRNEKIEGDKAIAELKGGAFINWTAFVFIKENGSWKFTGGSPETQSVLSQSNSNKVK